MEARDWNGAAEFLSPTIVIIYTETNERFEGANFLAMNQAYPEGWHIEVVEVLEADDRVAAQVRVIQEPDVFWCLGFYTVEAGVIVNGVEHWLTQGSLTPPEWRRRYASS